MAKGPTNEQTLIKVVPVKIWARNPSTYVLTYLFIDEGSCVNMCSLSLVERLGVAMCKSSVQLLTCNATSMVDKKVDFMALQGVKENSIFAVHNAQVVEEIVDVSSSVPSKELSIAYPL